MSNQIYESDSVEQFQFFTGLLTEYEPTIDCQHVRCQKKEDPILNQSAVRPPHSMQLLKFMLPIS